MSKEDESLEKYIDCNISWIDTPLVGYLAFYNGKRLVVRMNDFPDNDAYTLFVAGNEIANFNNWPESWSR